MSRVLVIDDEAPMRRALRIGLRAGGYQVDLAATGTEGLELARRRPPDLVILDLGLPGPDGIEVARSLRADSPVPILVLTARGGEAVKAAALEAGADDYVTKPFAMDELLARIRTALRPAGPAGRDGPPVDGTGPAGVVTTADFSVDLAGRQVRDRRGEVRLSPILWHLLEVLVARPGVLVTEQQLLEEVWGPGDDRATHHLRVSMAQLRQKLEPDPAHPRYLHTETGLGYRFDLGE